MKCCNPVMPVWKNMSKEVNLHGTKLKKKHLTLVCLTNEKVVYLKNKEALVFDFGIVCIKTRTSVYYYETSLAEETDIRFFVYTADDLVTIEILDEQLNQEWTQIFGYFFDEEGSIVMYADRELLPVFGIRICSQGELQDSARQEAILVAAIWGHKLLEKVLQMLTKEKDWNNQSFIPDGGEENIDA